MNVCIEIQKDKLHKEEFCFWFCESDETIYLDIYRIMQRTTPRHKYEIIKQYARLDHQRNPMKWIKPEDVPLTEELKKQAINMLISRLKVDIWRKQ